MLNNITKENFPIYIRDDGSYVIQNNGLPYHVIKDDKYCLYSIEDIKKYLSDNKKSAIQEKSIVKTDQEIIQELEAYLSNTDWYVIRNQETGKEIPNDILVERQNARDKISEHKGNKNA